jgi:CheY-like chemotaxis protein
MSAKKVLVVEDDKAMRATIVTRLKNHGYEVVEAEDGVQATERWASDSPSLVLLDMMLPKKDGFEVLKEMRGHTDPKVAATPVLVLTNLWSKDDIDRANSLKIDGYFVKAYLTTEEIAEKVEELLGKA